MNVDAEPYFGQQERIAHWRREILTRMNRLDELPMLPATTRHNLAREAGVVVEVPSFLGTQNLPDAAVLYATPTPEGGQQQFGPIRFAYEDPGHPALAELRETYDLERIAGDGPDFERVRRVRDWIKSIFPHSLPLTMPVWDARLILQRATRGVERFICIHYSVSLVQCCLALGIPARMVNLHRGIADSYRIGDEAVADPPVDEHVVAEAWCEEAGTWVLFDTDFDCDYTWDGRPCSAWDIHRAFVSGRAGELSCHRGAHSEAFDAYGVPKVGPEEFFQYELPSYYAHVSILMRNDFVGDPTGPVTIAHPLDEHTAPILWHRGSDNRLQPHLMGPVVVAQPWVTQTEAVTDGNLATSWASDDIEGDKHATIHLAGPRLVSSVGIHWPQHGRSYQSSTAYGVQTRTPEGDWVAQYAVSDAPESGFAHIRFDHVTTSAVRVFQPAGGGSADHPQRLWISQFEVNAP